MDEKKFRTNVMTLQRLMYSLALRIGLSPEDAADAVQETQLRLWRGREGLPDSAGALKSYCMIAMRNECVTILRRKKETIPFESLPEAFHEETERMIEGKEAANRLEQIIKSLPLSQQKVIRLSSFAELEISEIVEITGFSPGNVRQLLSRGRKRIRELLLKEKTL